MMRLHDIPQINDMCLCESTDGSLSHLNRMEELLLSQLDLKVVILLVLVDISRVVLLHNPKSSRLLQELKLGLIQSRIGSSIVLPHKTAIQPD